MPSVWSPQFVFAVCQRGAERALKQEIARLKKDMRPAFSRPGFLTFKLAEPCHRPDRFQLVTTFARAAGFSFGKLAGTHAQELASRLWQMPDVLPFVEQEGFADIHVWQRDRGSPAGRRYETVPTVLAREIEQVVRSCSPLVPLRTMPASPRPPSRRNRWVLDVVMVEPSEWWVGCHRTSSRTDCWPGGVFPVQLPENAVSRAYGKMAESIAWSALPLRRGDRCVELGCAPGGAAQALLDRGIQVIGVDPAEVAAEVGEHPHFRHLRCRSSKVSGRHLRGVQWLAADMNVAPQYTLDAIEDIVFNKVPTVRGMVLTLKLLDWDLAQEIPSYVKRVRSWGYRDVRTRQLAANGQEICLVALRSRGQRRVRRSTRERSRIDVGHASVGRPPHFSLHL